VNIKSLDFSKIPKLKSFITPEIKDLRGISEKIENFYLKRSDAYYELETVQLPNLPFVKKLKLERIYLPDINFSIITPVLEELSLIKVDLGNQKSLESLILLPNFFRLKLDDCKEGNEEEGFINDIILENFLPFLKNLKVLELKEIIEGWINEGEYFVDFSLMENLHSLKILKVSLSNIVSLSSLLNLSLDTLILEQNKFLENTENTEEVLSLLSKKVKHFKEVGNK
jgi:hypothetical protein